MRKLAKFGLIGAAACVVVPATAFACGFPGRGHQPRPPNTSVRSGTAFTITSAIYPSPGCSGPTALLSPGVTRCFVYTVKNNLHVPIAVQKITATLDPHYAAPPSGCRASDLSLPTFSGSLQVAGDGRANSAGLPISLIDTKTNQDNCENTTLHFVYTGRALSMAATSTTLSSSPDPSLAGQPVTFTATVTAPHAPAPTGRVNFYACATAGCGSSDLLGSGLIGPHGKVSFTTRCLPTGTTYVEAAYAGASTDFSSSTSKPVVQVVKSAVLSTATTLSSSADPSVSGQSVSFTAVVTTTSGTGHPTGTVTFSRCSSPSICTGSSVLGSAPLTSGRATFSTSTLPSGTTYVRAVYSGIPGSFGSSASSVITEVVTAPIKTTTGLTTTPDPSTTGQPVTLNATVSPVTGAAPPTGTVSFYVGAAAGAHAVLGTATLNGSGQAQLTTPALAPGTDSVYAVYSGSAAFLASTSPTISQGVISPPPPCTATPFAGSHCIWVGDVSSSISAGDGNLTVVAGDGTDTLVLGNGNDWVTFGNGSQSRLTLGNGNDTVELGSGSHNAITLGGGDDTVTIGGSDDQIHGGSGNETVYLGAGTDNTFVGGGGHNVCHLPPSTAAGTAAAHYHDTISNCTVVTP